MGQPDLPHVDDLPSSGVLVQTQVLDLLFEPSPAIHATILPVIQAAQYRSYPDLVDACQVRLLSLAAGSAADCPSPELLSILGSHPRLGEKRVESAQSAAEQASLGGGDDGDELAALNREYEAKFPGLRYVVFVNGRPRPEIIRDMRARIDRGDHAEEVAAALLSMCDIAKDRASKLRVRPPKAEN